MASTMTIWVYLEDIQTWARLYGWPTEGPKWYAVSWNNGRNARREFPDNWDSLEKCSVYNDIMKSGGLDG